MADDDDTKPIAIDGYDGLTHIVDDARLPLCGTTSRPLVHGGINVARCITCIEAYNKLPDAVPMCFVCGFRHRLGDKIACKVLKEMRGGTIH